MVGQGFGRWDSVFATLVRFCHSAHSLELGRFQLRAGSESLRAAVGRKYVRADVAGFRSGQMWEGKMSGYEYLGDDHNPHPHPARTVYPIPNPNPNTKTNTDTDTDSNSNSNSNSDSNSKSNSNSDNDPNPMVHR